MSALLRRLVRLWGQSRIRLPRRSLGPADIAPGDRLQIGSAVWRVRGRLRLAAGGWMLRLEAVGEVPGDREARLVIPPAEEVSHREEVSRWEEVSRRFVRFFHNGTEHLLPPEGVLHFPAAALTNRNADARITAL